MANRGNFVGKRTDFFWIDRKKIQFPLKSSNSLQSGRSAISEHAHSSSVRRFKLIDSVGGTDTFARTVQCSSTCHVWANWFAHSISEKKMIPGLLLYFYFTIRLLFFMKTQYFQIFQLQSELILFLKSNWSIWMSRFIDIDFGTLKFKVWLAIESLKGA